MPTFYRLEVYGESDRTQIVNIVLFLSVTFKPLQKLFVMLTKINPYSANVENMVSS